jgi:NAD(P)-dependent dehydrogenase (short-subunit alcohol dehydrogenase family)
VGQDGVVDLGLRDRTYIVTGASAGLGFATAKALAAEGARLVISSRNEESIARAAAELNALPGPGRTPTRTARSGWPRPRSPSGASCTAR